MKRFWTLWGGAFTFGVMAALLLWWKMPGAALAVLALGAIVLYAIVLELNRLQLTCNHKWVSGRKKKHSALVVAYCEKCPATFSGW